MAHLLRVAEVATGATEAVLHEWGVAEQGAFSAGDVIATLETDKAVVDVEADTAGVLVARLVPEGAAVEVGRPIALLAEPGEQVPDVAAELARLGAAADQPARRQEHLADQGTDDDRHNGRGLADAGPRWSPSGSGASVDTARPEVDQSSSAHPERVFSSPLARRMAREAGIAVEDLVGTGPGGRIVKRDVRAALHSRALGSRSQPTGDRSDAARTGPSAAKTAAAFSDVPHSAVRRATATRLTASKQSTPHFYLRAGVEVDELLVLRRQLEQAGVLVSLNDLVVRAVVLAHVRVPQMNVIWTPDAVRSYSSVDVAVAVSTDRGLLTPVLRRAESLSIGELARASRDLVDRCRRGDLRQHELEGGTVTVTNLGMFGVEEFTAIINPPQSAILAVGAAREQPVAHEGQLQVRSVMRVVLAVDHRPVDGTIAARWLGQLVELLEQPVRLML